MRRKSLVYIVIRHTRSGDVRSGIYDSKERAHAAAEAIAELAAELYGHDRTSVFSASLTLTGKPLRPSGERGDA